MKIIESIDQWNKFELKLKEHGYERWQMQFDINHPEGFHAWFWKADNKDIEVITHNEEVYKAIVQYSFK
jgi:hypothetical protein